jgi:SAM domain (Sterile alpha motif)
MEARHQPAKAPPEITLTAASSAHEVQQWLCESGLEHLGPLFRGYTGAVMCQLTREEATQICDTVSDGILVHKLVAMSAGAAASPSVSLQPPQEVTEIDRYAAHEDVVLCTEAKRLTPADYPGLFECSQSPRSCLASVLCCPCFTGWLLARRELDEVRAMGKSTRHWCTCCWVYWYTVLSSLPFMCCCLSPRPSVFYDASQRSIGQYRAYPRGDRIKAMCVGCWCPCCSLVQVEAILDSLDAKEGHKTESYWEFCCNHRWACLS